MPTHALHFTIDHKQRSDWVEFKKTKFLMVPRPRLVDYIVRLGISLALIYQSNIYIAAIWLLMSIGIDLLIANKMKLCNQQVTDEASMAGNEPIVNQYKYYWYFNTFWFGCTSFIFAGQQTIESQMVLICCLSLISLLCVAKTSAHTEFCYRIIFIIIFSQLAGVLWNIAVVFDYNAPGRHNIYAVYLLLQYLVLLRISNVFCKYMRKNFELQFDNNSLINDLYSKTELLEKERKIAVSANQTIQRFYSNAAHDVRQPVYAMQMYASMLHDDASLGDVLLPKIQQSCIGINTLFNSLFDFQQLKLGTIDYKPAKIDIDHLLQELSIQFTPFAQKKNLKIKFKYVEGSVFIDDILIKRILGNLIVNAIKYSREGGLLVAVRHIKNKKKLNFEIWDTGVGISDEDKLSIFNEFFKVPGHKIATDEGFGLGLSIVRQLSQLVVGSEITVQSRLHRGSVFKFSVPDSLYSASWSRLISEFDDKSK
jgi:signal transduction histidine kinase